MEGFQHDVMNYVKPNHGTTTLGFVFKQGVIVACDSRASQGSYICEALFLSRALQHLWLIIANECLMVSCFALLRC